MFLFQKAICLTVFAPPAIFQPSFFKSSQNLVFQWNIETEPRKTLLTFHYTGDWVFNGDPYNCL